jgi:hypothetical protein
MKQPFRTEGLFSNSHATAPMGIPFNKPARKRRPQNADIDLNWAMHFDPPPGERADKGSDPGIGFKTSRILFSWSSCSRAVPNLSNSVPIHSSQRPRITAWHEPGARLRLEPPSEIASILHKVLERFRMGHLPPDAATRCIRHENDIALVHNGERPKSTICRYADGWPMLCYISP